MFENGVFREMFWTKKVPDSSMVSKEDWVSVLKVSTLWRCLRLRKMAICELQSLVWPIKSTELIVWGRKYSICSWVGCGYEEVVKSGYISDEQMEAIGALESFKLSRIILENRKASPALSLLQRIKENFREELQSIAAAEALLRSR